MFCSSLRRGSVRLNEDCVCRNSFGWNWFVDAVFFPSRFAMFYHQNIFEAAFLMLLSSYGWTWKGLLQLMGRPLSTFLQGRGYGRKMGGSSFAFVSTNCQSQQVSATTCLGSLISCSFFICGRFVDRVTDRHEVMEKHPSFGGIIENGSSSHGEMEKSKFS